MHCSKVRSRYVEPFKETFCRPNSFWAFLLLRYASVLPLATVFSLCAPRDWHGGAGVEHPTLPPVSTQGTGGKRNVLTIARVCSRPFASVRVRSLPLHKLVASRSFIVTVCVRRPFVFVLKCRHHDRFPKEELFYWCLLPWNGYGIGFSALLRPLGVIKLVTLVVFIP